MILYFIEILKSALNHIKSYQSININTKEDQEISKKINLY